MHKLAMPVAMAILACTGCNTISGFGKDLNAVGTAVSKSADNAAKPETRYAAKKSTRKLASKAVAKPAAVKTSATAATPAKASDTRPAAAPAQTAAKKAS